MVHILAIRPRSRLVLYGKNYLANITRCTKLMVNMYVVQPQQSQLYLLKAHQHETRLNYSSTCSYISLGKDADKCRKFIIKLLRTVRHEKLGNQWDSKYEHRHVQR